METVGGLHFFMASLELIKTVESYEAYRERHGVDYDFLNAYLMACDAAYGEGDSEYLLEHTRLLKGYISELIHRDSDCDFWTLERYLQGIGEQKEIIDIGYKAYKLESFYRFESFLFYLEKNRKYDKRFYVPRRKTQAVVVQDLQDLEDDLLDTYSLSEPSRVGKTTTLDMFMAWVGAKKPWSHNAYGGHSGQLAKRFFRGLDNIVETPEYTFNELFTFYHPKMKKCVESKSSDPAEYTINLGEPDEFATFTCRGIDGTWTGAIDVSEDGYLCVDDLVRDREHSMSPSRMENTYQEYQNKMLDRMNDGAKKVLIGTLWGVYDPIERERRLNDGNPRARFRKIPALTENDESNFEYEVKGFSAKYYIQMRERLDKAEWMAKFQQQPFVREGLVLPIEQLRFFDGNLTDGKNRTWAALDPAFGGGDFVSMPVCRDYGDFKPIIDWVYDKRTPAYTVPLVVDSIINNGITRLQIEKNRGGDLYAEKVKDELKRRGYNGCKVELKSAPQKISKEEKISAYSDYVKRNFSFMTHKSLANMPDVVPTDAYLKALDAMSMYSPEGKNVNDDAPDSISQLAIMFESRGSATVEAVENPFRRGM